MVLGKEAVNSNCRILYIEIYISFIVSDFHAVSSDGVL